MFLGDLTISRILSLFSRYSPLVPARSKNPEGLWDTSCASWVAVFGEHRIIQMVEGGEWQNDLCVDLRADRYIKLQSHGAGSHPWISGRRNGLAREIFNRMQANGRYAGRQLL